MQGEGKRKNDTTLQLQSTLPFYCVNMIFNVGGYNNSSINVI